jgi:glycine/D-amino acid oxidase-like deaminating enzyme
MSMTGLRVVVVGAGAIGLATALELGRRGHRVDVVEAGTPGSGTTGTSFAWINGYAKLPRAYFDLNRAGVAAHRAFAADGPGEWLAMSGRIEWTVEPEERTALGQRVERARAWGDSPRLLTTAEARAMEPDVRIPVDAEIWFFPDEGHLFGGPFVRYLAEAARAAGVRILTSRRVVGFERSGDDLSAARLDDGSRLEATVFVSCVGRWTDELARLAGGHVPMLGSAQPSRAPGFLAYTPPVRTRLGRILSAPGLMARPESGGRLILQASEFDGQATLDQRPAIDGAVARTILARARAILEAFDAPQLESFRVGVRAIPADGLPVVGRLPGAGGLYVIATHSGITLSILLGRLAADEIETDVRAPELEPFRPERLVAGPSASSR